MPFDFTIMDTQVKGMRDMNPVKFTYKGQEYTGFRDVLNTEMQMSLYGAHDAVKLSIGIPRSDLKAEIQKGEKVTVYTPFVGRTGKTMWIIGAREDAGGLTVRIDLEVRYTNG
jgi:hypothetical protein